jgi:hypothetical protein
MARASPRRRRQPGPTRCWVGGGRSSTRTRGLNFSGEHRDFSHN